MDRVGRNATRNSYRLGDDTKTIVINEIHNEIRDIVNGAPLAFWELFEYRGFVWRRLHGFFGKEAFVLNDVVKIPVEIPTAQ